MPFVTLASLAPQEPRLETIGVREWARWFRDASPSGSAPQPPKGLAVARPQPPKAWLNHRRSLRRGPPEPRATGWRACSARRSPRGSTPPACDGTSPGSASPGRTPPRSRALVRPDQADRQATPRVRRAVLGQSSREVGGAADVVAAVGALQHVDPGHSPSTPKAGTAVERSSTGSSVMGSEPLRWFRDASPSGSAPQPPKVRGGSAPQPPKAPGAVGGDVEALVSLT